MTQQFRRIQPSTGEEIDDSAMAQRANRLAIAERLGISQTLQLQGARSLRVWDNVDNDWLLEPVPDYQVMQICLKEAVLKCSACSFTSGAAGGTAKHLREVKQSAAVHKTASITSLPPLPGQPFREGCSGCGATFSRRRTGQRHLDTALALSSQHQGLVEEIRLFRFSLGPGGSGILSRTQVQAGVPGPEASQEARSLGERKRNRSRGRNRRRRNGSTAL